MWSTNMVARNSGDLKNLLLCFKPVIHILVENLSFDFQDPAKQF